MESSAESLLGLDLLMCQQWRWLVWRPAPVGPVATLRWRPFLDCYWDEEVGPLDYLLPPCEKLEL